IPYTRCSAIIAIRARAPMASPATTASIRSFRRSIETRRDARGCRGRWRLSMPRRYYVLWLIGMALTEIGSTLDVSWHFGHVFDEISPSHLTSFSGTCLMAGLLLWALIRERKRVVGLERKALIVA